MNANLNNRGFVTQGKIFLLILLSLIGVFIFSNTNIILSSFGFETTTNLKSKLVKTQTDLEQIIELNKDKDKQLELERANAKALQEEIKDLYAAKESARQKVDVIQAKKKEDTKDTIAKIKDEEIVNDSFVQYPKKEIDKLSAANIDQVTDAFDQLFTEV